MSDLVEQLRALDELHRSGSLSDAEFDAAKAQLLAGNKTSDEPQSTLFLQTELARIDREWELERERYKFRGRYNSWIPESGQGTQTGTFTTIFGLIWTGIATFIAFNATSIGAPIFFWAFPLFGIFFIRSGLTSSGEMNQKADAHQIAEQAYQARRAEIVRKLQSASEEQSHAR